MAQTRVTFTSSEVGNGQTNDSNTMPNQDGGPAVRLQAEDATGGLTGPVTRSSDEGVTFVAAAGDTYDVRDLVSGVARGDQFEVVALGTQNGDAMAAVAAARPYYFNGGQGDDVITDGTSNDFLVGGAGADTLTATLGNDSFIGGGGDDAISGGEGADVATANVLTDGADVVDLGGGEDVVNVNTNAGATTNVRLSFTSAEVGNGSAVDSNTMANQDGGLAVRLQAEDAAGTPTGAVSRYDDEGVTFVGGAGVTFDVRDLVSGVARGEEFEVVRLGTQGADTLASVQAARPYYINGGQGDDVITDGTANDFLVGGAGADTLIATLGDDSFIGGGGDDAISGGEGADVATANVLTDGADVVDLGAGEDVVNVNTNAGATTNVRLSFTSSEVGNGAASDSNTMANQDGGLAVRLQAEDAAGTPNGAVSRYDDEGVTFVGGAGVTFDVRDLVSGLARGEAFEVVRLGTQGADALGALQAARPYYINGGQGDDVITDGTSNDFLVGGAGNDTLTATLGNDSFIGGGGDDVISGGAGADVATLNVSTDGADAIDLGADADVVNVNANAATNVRLTFTSAEVGNGSAVDSGGLANQDGGLAVRLQGEDAAGVPAGPTTRVDDEGITFVAGAGVTFDVRDLVSGTARGEAFEVVSLGTSGADALAAVQSARPYYINAGQGDDLLTGGTANDFLVGGAGVDTMAGGLGSDSYIVDNSADRVIEADVAGVDTVLASVSYSIRMQYVENLTLTGTADISAEGNALDNVLIGNSGNNLLNGRVGADTMIGGAGDDIYIVQKSKDVVIEENVEGVDLVHSWVSFSLRHQYIENLQLAGGRDIDGEGNALANSITGTSGDNVIDGRAGADVLRSGAGADIFNFTTRLGSGNVDTILDFSRKDLIGLSSEVFVGLSAGALDADAFVRGTAAQDAEDRIIYDRSTGSLFFDRDGSGTEFGARKFAIVDTMPRMSADDFIVS